MLACRGVFASVFRALDLKTGEDVAVKVLYCPDIMPHAAVR